MADPKIRDQIKDHLLTPKNCALIIIDYQPLSIGSVRSMDQQLLVDNIVRVAKTAKAYGLPVVVSTAGVNTMGNKSMIPDQDARTIARWTGGLEDLQRRRYIKDLGHKGEVFEVTREGFEAADGLSEV